ncbi:MAG: hypothetical protein FJX47_11835, partial [Alphaproteobacteria bacterium]|nr:hypothetical protein [Alphaproteobacteria bacterium]
GFSRPVIKGRGRPAYGKGRESAGILGANILDPCVDMVGRAMGVIRKQRLDLKVIAVGGVFAPEHAERYFATGASAVTMGSAPMFDPGLAARMKRLHPEW